MRIFLKIAYDGTNYSGWQFQNNADSIQERIENALGQVFNMPVRVEGASRTDAGVHALGQVAAFNVDECKIPLDKLPNVINAYLPDDIVVNLASEVDESFSPRFSAKSKSYSYRIFCADTENPLLNRYTAFVPKNLDITLMQKASCFFVGKHDFAAFCATGSSAKTTVREIYSLEVIKNDNLIEIKINGNAFLYNMVRIIAGTLVSVGVCKIPYGSILEIIMLKDRTKAGKTMPAKGLTLERIYY